MHYYGQTFRTFKERFYGHQYDLRNSHKAESTTLSQYFWKMRELGEQPEILWSKVTSAKPYLLGGRTCQLCITEKTAIARDTSGVMLNRRRELMNKCLHKEPFKLSNFYSSPLQQLGAQDVQHDQLHQENQDQLVQQDVQVDQVLPVDQNLMVQLPQGSQDQAVQLGAQDDQDFRVDQELDQVPPVQPEIVPQEEQPEDAPAVHTTIHPPEPPDQALPRRSNRRSVRRKFENLCEENLSNFKM